MYKKTKIAFLLAISTFSMCLINLNESTNYVHAEEEREAAAIDRTLINTYNKAGNYTVGKYGVYSKIDSLDDLVDIKDSTEKPTSAIFYVNSDMELVDANNVSLGITVKEAYDTYLKNAVIPLIYLDDATEATAFIDYHTYTFNMLDMGIISANPEVVKSVRTEIKTIRGILDYTNKSLKTNKELGKAVNETNACYANSMILNEDDATSDAVYYVQARFKTVLVNAITKTSALNILEQYESGVYGILTDNYHDVYTAYKNFANIVPSKSKNLTRRPYNIAHRGECISNYENSLEGCIKAYEDGATHFEIDIQVTKDSKLAIMHDDTMVRTTNFNEVAAANGLSTSKNKISDYTLEELKQFKIMTNYKGTVMGEGVDIPSLDDIFTYFKDKDIVIIVEIKTSDTRTCRLLKQYLDSYDIYDQVVVISFYTAQLQAMKTTIPEIPTADLNNYKFESASFINSVASLNSLNTACDTNNYYDTSDLKRYLAVRGVSTWLWTYETVSNAQLAVRSGAIGVTSNEAEKLADVGLELYQENNYLVSQTDNIATETVKLKYTTYGGLSEKTIDCTPIYVEDHEKYALVIYYGLFVNDYTQHMIYSNTIKVIKKEYYVSYNDIKAILDKENANIVEDDIATLNKAKENLDLLTSEEQALVSAETITTKITAYNTYLEEQKAKAEEQKETSDTPSDENEDDNKGCNGNASSILFVLVSLLFFLKKKKEM